MKILSCKLLRIIFFFCDKKKWREKNYENINRYMVSMCKYVHICTVKPHLFTSMENVWDEFFTWQFDVEKNNLWDLLYKHFLFFLRWNLILIFLFILLLIKIIAWKCWRRKYLSIFNYIFYLICILFIKLFHIIFSLKYQNSTAEKFKLNHWINSILNTHLKQLLT